jgi:hypothetical protein
MVNYKLTFLSKLKAPRLPGSEARGAEPLQPDALSEVSTQSEAMQARPTFSRSDLGAGLLLRGRTLHQYLPLSVTLLGLV